MKNLNCNWQTRYIDSECVKFRLDRTRVSRLYKNGKNADVDLMAPHCLEHIDRRQEKTVVMGLPNVVRFASTGPCSIRNCVVSKFTVILRPFSGKFPRLDL